MRIYNLKTRCVFIISAIVLFFVTIEGANVKHDLQAGIGFPRGGMVVNFDIDYLATMNIDFPVCPQLLCANSYSFRKDISGGFVHMATTSLFILGKAETGFPDKKISPFISGGWGLHILASFSTKNTVFGKHSKFHVTSKAHSFYGMDYHLNDKWYLTGYGRITYPSDITFDLWNIHLGYRF